MTSFSFSERKKAVKAVNPVEVELRKDWDAICARVESLVTGAPADTLDKAAEQAEWVAVWQNTMASTRGSFVGGSILTVMEYLAG